MARQWRNCNASVKLVEAVNTKWPKRDKASDGTIGDADHASRSSDHNPWIVVDGWGIVRARDIDVDGIDAAWLAERLRQKGAAGDRRLTGGGYVIYNRRITSPDFRSWRAYTGSNPHTSHLHVSFSQNQAGFDSTAAWDLGGGAAAPAPAGRPTLRKGASGAAVTELQNLLARAGFPAGAVDGRFGPATEAAVRRFQTARRLTVDGIVGPATWTALLPAPAKPAPTPQEDDLPSPADVWDFKIDDPFKANLPRKSAAAMLGWAATHAAYARGEATAAAQRAAGALAAVDKLADALANQQQVDAAAIKTAVREAIEQSVVDVDVTVRDSTG